jgi:alcohol dehydrogenase
MATYRVQQAAAGGPFAEAERELEPPAPGHVRIAVEACGVCHTDTQFVDGKLQGLGFPVVPGHEIAGRIAEVGESGGIGERTAEVWRVGDRVTVGWFGGSCRVCVQCRAGDFAVCPNLKVPGWAYDGGYAESVIAPVDALARIPDTMNFEDAAPLSCAGVTTFNGLRWTGAQPGGRAAILGIGGLGHLAVRFAVAMGFETIAIARGPEKAEFARELGAHHYIDSTVQADVGQALQSLGGVDVLLATAANSKAISATVGGLTPRGQLVVIGIDEEPVEIIPLQLIVPAKVVRGVPAGTARDVEDTLAFSALHDIRPIIETVPLDQANEAYQKMLSGAARFRMVLTPR